MKIIYGKPPQEEFTILRIVFGEVFMYKGDFYCKTTKYTPGCNKIECLDLETGEIVSLPEDLIVRPIDATLIVEE